MTSRPARPSAPGQETNTEFPYRATDSQLRDLIALIDKALGHPMGNGATNPSEWRHTRTATAADLHAATINPADLPRIDPGDATP